MTLLLPIRNEPHKPRSLNRIPQAFLVLETRARVVPLHDVAEVIRERLDGGVILVIDVIDFLDAERALFAARIRAPLLLSLLSHSGLN
jgi:hypothetical protein